MTGNHHHDYKTWCLAKWVIVDLPGVVRANIIAKAQSQYQIRDAQNMPERLLRATWLENFERRHGKVAADKLKADAKKIHEDLRRGVVPVYDGPYQQATRPL